VILSYESTNRIFAVLKLFVSHASEDKDDFARPLALALRQSFEVWFDEFSLRAGDSLRSSIDDGLRKCDYGIVVLSPHFLGKKWTVSEINGLFALEGANKKIIIPIWYNVGLKQVTDFSPILADRLAINAAQGLEKVVEEIKIAVGFAQRKYEVVAPDESQRALDGLMEKLVEFDLNETVLISEAGVSLFKTALSKVEGIVWDKLQGVNILDKMRFARAQASYFTIRGPFSTNLSIYTREVYANSIKNCEVLARVFLPQDPFHRPHPETLDELKWSVTCLSSTRIGFKSEGDARALSEDDVAARIVRTYCGIIASRVGVRV
jgi:hypothetical protein